MIIHMGLSRDGKHVKLAEDVDTLSPQVRYYAKYEFANLDEVLTKTKELEAAGYHVCVDFTEHFYETECAC